MGTSINRKTEERLGFMQVVGPHLSFISYDEKENTAVIDIDNLKEYTDFLIDHSKQEEARRVDGIISRLLAQFANTPLDQRETGWQWLLKLRDEAFKQI